MIEKFNATHIAGPNFAYRLFAKRMKAAGRKFDNTRLYQANIAAEPIDPATLTAMKEIGISDSAIMPCYGLAEVCAYATACIGDEVRNNEDGVVSCGLLKRNEAKGKFIKIASDCGKILEEGEVGEIYIRGPDLASGYWNKPDLSKQFHCNLSDGEEYFATGDLGQIEGGRLYVVGRLKELIIINGRNVYPQDIERVIESAYPDVVRPGSTVAFQNTDNDIGITLEIRNTFKSLGETSATFSETSIQRLVSDACGVKIGDLKMLKQGSSPKTTSGKLKRVETRRMSLEGRWPAERLLYDSLTSSTLSKLDCQCGKVDVETTIKSVVGHTIEMEADWATNGLTSLMHAELISKVQEVHQSTLPFNFQSTCATPNQLKGLVEASSSPLFAVKLSDLEPPRKWFNTSKSLSLSFLGMLQAFGTFLLILILVVCVLASYVVGKCTAVLLSTDIQIGHSEKYVTLSWVPITIPAFLFIFSLAVILLKWIVIGRYNSCCIDLPSVAYLRWWFIDRLLDLWERWVGDFIIDTKIIWIFYRLLGARLALSCTVKSFVREFDLVDVGSDCLIEHQIRCRKFRPWDEDKPPSMVFRQIIVQDGCLIKGMLGPGVHVGSSSKVEKFSAVSEGCQVPQNVTAKGSPAYNAGSHDGSNREHGYWRVELSKVIWLVVELYIFSSLFSLAQISLGKQQLQRKWRYGPLLYWILLLVLTSIYGIILSIILKWVFIGRRRPANGEPRPWQRICRWCCDYHYRMSRLTLASLLGTSRVWNAVLFLHGLDIDYASKFIAGTNNLPPSKVDLVRIRRSFTATSVTLDTDEYVEILDSSLGYSVHIAQGVKIHRSVVPPQRIISQSIYDINSRQCDESWRPSCAAQILMESYLLVCGLLVCVSFIPSYELFVATIPKALPGLVVLWLCLIAHIQCVVWILIERLLQAALYLSNGTSHRFAVFHSAVDFSCINHSWNILLTSSLGTFFIGLFLRLLGARIEGEFWCFGSAIYDTPRLSFEDKTIVDDAYITGHYIVFDELRLGDTRIGGVLHPGTACTCGTVLKSRESGPWKVYHGVTIKRTNSSENTDSNIFA